MFDSLLIKLQTSRLATLLKGDTNTCFPVNIAKVLRTPNLKHICERLLQSFDLFMAGDLSTSEIDERRYLE